ncbi:MULTISPECIES: LysR substrate-binding domain-containing protein [Rhodobacterales]|uniref:LysR substrate-binding domain-containing protein n=1 Tax=Rhodobacterales TaxID=204455 RepID=UPI00237F41EC|nr:LysR substrate-binding domain-containing protein [Phaeobacter gallaeciensis]MDE4142824.1 LysR substrate-binding domain-containing protein [Phaeobacter gallaeciensis]MDE4151271.1 LysR substrate-binding domain-containing protein [Phaeobacter gallaeciensis]MDE4155502.1 LysR substrate-binding domain-containing protein [Phaeobacter gallaeciensis]MDE4230893.1 LysR substrate-binding domain-containing protein [Phaeobacter gallaeciensis]MDE4259993.1 LysR substrate-binding domain-containing protein [
MRKLPPLNAIRAFEAVARRLSFADAGDELGVTATAISHQIRHLEAYLGFQLVERRPRQIALTPAGQELFPKLQTAFDTLGEAFAMLDKDVEQSLVRVTTTYAFAERWLVPRLSDFFDKHGDIRVEVETDDDVLDLRTGRLDLAIRYGPQSAANEEAEILVSDRYIPVSLADQPETGAQDCRLLGYRWRNADMGGPTWEEWFKEVGETFPPDRITRFSDESAAFNALDQGLGLLLSSSVLVDEGLKSGRYRQIQGPELHGFDYCLVLNPLSRNKHGVKIFAEWLRQAAEQA